MVFLERRGEERVGSDRVGSDRVLGASAVALGGVDEGGDVGLGGLLQDAVAEVEDVSVARAAGVVDAGLDGLLDGVGVGEEEGGVDVPLDGDGRAEGGPRGAEVDRPVDGERGEGVVGDHVALKVEVGAAAIGEEDEGDVRVGAPDGTGGAHGVGLGEGLEVGRGEVVGPGLEELDELGAVVDLVDGVLGDGVGGRGEEGVGERGI
mmetsp:Transcript_22130/g.69244  ORF Transcript_22130/g.69244 Transcript_22130/m.69244 type:complete len:206 (-) Transcript_22130:694-1311(-)